MPTLPKHRRNPPADIEGFRADLAATLRFMAERKRQRLGERDDFAQALHAIRLLDDLADDAGRLSPGIFQLYCSLFASARLSAIYRREQPRLFDRIGLDYSPVDANDLMGWLIREVFKAADRETPQASVVFSSRMALSPLARRFLVDLSGGFGLVAPILGLWQGKTAFEQWRDGAFASNHPSVQARVERLDSGEPGRGSGWQTAELHFVPGPGAEACRLNVTARPGHSFPPAGHMVEVVPRGANCVEPLVPSQIGSAGMSFALSLSMIVLGLAFLRLWGVLCRRAAWVSPEGRLSSPLRRSAYREPRPRPAL